MQVCLLAEPQEGATYDDLLALARLAEALDFDGLFRSDHLMATSTGDGEPGPTETWVTLAGLARETTGLRIGTLMGAATLRHPSVLAVAAAQVDVMSGGRLEVGLGTGWHRGEHTTFGIPLPPEPDRFDELEDQLAICRGLWASSEDRFDFDGHHHTLRSAPRRPRPAQPGGPPLIVGGYGSRRTPTLAARYAAEHNAAFATVARTEVLQRAVDTACEREGRDPADLRRSAVLACCCAEDDRRVAERATAMGRDLEDLRAKGVAGTPAEVVDALQAYGALGLSRVYLQLRRPRDLEHVQVLGEHVLPHLR